MAKDGVLESLQEPGKKKRTCSKKTVNTGEPVRAVERTMILGGTGSGRIT